MQWLSALQTAQETAVMYTEYLRQNYLLPFAQLGGQDMYLLKNGQWVPKNVQAPHIARYELSSHTIFSVQEEAEKAEKTVKTVRWPWLSVVAGDKDLSDFFTGLRITSGCTISDESALMLFAYQKGWAPEGEITITLRDGSIHIIRDSHIR